VKKRLFEIALFVLLLQGCIPASNKIAASIILNDHITTTKTPSETKILSKTPLLSPTSHVESIEDQSRAAGTYGFGPNSIIPTNYDPFIPCKGYPVIDFAENMDNNYYYCFYKIKLPVNNVINYYINEIPKEGFILSKSIASSEGGLFIFTNKIETVFIIIFQLQNEPGYTSVSMEY
jgi:hypothetical protein